MPTNGFSIKPLKVKPLAGEQKATEYTEKRKAVDHSHSTCAIFRAVLLQVEKQEIDTPVGKVEAGFISASSSKWVCLFFEEPRDPKRKAEVHV